MNNYLMKNVVTSYAMIVTIFAMIVTIFELTVIRLCYYLLLEYI